MPDLFIQPSQANMGATQAGAWARQVPTPGLPAVPVPPVLGVATCANLLQDSPPSLFEEYVLQSYSIGFAALASCPTFPGILKAELALLVNDEVRHVNVMSTTSPTNVSLEDNALYSDAWTADLTNPIMVGARDRLAIRAGMYTDTADNGATIAVGTQLGMTAGTNNEFVIPFSSTISYTTIALPGRRRL